MSERVKQALSRAVRKLLGPLVRILLRNGVPFGVFVELARRVYVDVAWREFGLPGRRQTVSRTSTITGLTRKDVTRVLNEPDGKTPPDVERYNRAARVLTGWLRDRAYQGENGRRSLAFEGTDDSFSGLVRKYSGDVTARAVLDELLRVGAVKKLKDGRIKLVARGYVPYADDEQKVSILGQDAADLISTIDHNLTSDPADAFFQRKVAYDNLVGEALAETRNISRDEAQKLLEKLDSVMARYDRDAQPNLEGSGRKRAVLGVYYLEEDLDDLEDEDEDEDKE